jgi:hypothetical protein
MPEFLTILCIGFLIFAACREIFCWYCKINRIVKLLEKIAANTAKPIACTDAENLDRR